AFRIQPSAGGAVPPNNPIAAAALNTMAASSGARAKGSSSSAGVNRLPFAVEELKLDSSMRPSDIATMLLVHETEKQAKSRWNMAVKLSSAVTETVKDWDRQFQTQLKMANEYGYVLLSEFQKVYDDIPKACRLYQQCAQDYVYTRSKYETYVHKY